MNNRAFLDEAVILLENNGITTWIFGGWAEELLGISEPRNHKDIDLLYPAKNFSKVEYFLNNDDQVQEVKAKHFNHKRAFVYKGVLIELLLLQNDNGRYFTYFWGKTIYYWPANTLEHKIESRITSKSALLDYRKNHKKLAGAGFKPAP